MLITTLTQNSFASSACESLFAPPSPPQAESKSEGKSSQEKILKFDEIDNQLIEFYPELNSLKEKIKWWQAVTRDSEKKAFSDIRSNRNEFLFLLKETEDTHLAIEKYSDVFLNVELSWLLLQEKKCNRVISSRDS